MNEAAKRLVYWAPRVLGIAFAAFSSIFALDALSTPGDIGQKTVALLMHLIPTGIVLLALLIAWRREWIGAIFFPLLAVVHVVPRWGRLDAPGYAMIDGPLLLLGLLFWLSWRNRAAPRTSPG